MTYNVFSGTLNLTQSINRSEPRNLTNCHVEFTQFFHGKLWFQLINRNSVGKCPLDLAVCL